MILTIPGTIRIYRGIRSSDYSQEAMVERERDNIIIANEKGTVHLRFTLEELRAIMRLFDTPQDNDE